MSKFNAKVAAALELVDEGKFDEAKALLATSDDPEAKRLLAQINGATVTRSTDPRRKRRSMLPLVGCLLLLIVGAWCILGALVGLATPKASVPAVAAKSTLVATSPSVALGKVAASTATLVQSPIATTGTPINTDIPTDDSDQIQHAIVPSFTPTNSDTDTPGPTNSPRNATATFVAMYTPIARGELMSYADKHTGDFVKVTGRVFHVIDDTDLQLFLAGSNDAVYVQSLDSYSGIYENDFVTVYGMVDGYATGTNAFGGDVKQPLIDNATVVK